MEKMSHDPIAADIGTQVSDNALHGVTAGSTALTIGDRAGSRGGR